MGELEGKGVIVSKIIMNKKVSVWVNKNENCGSNKWQKNKRRKGKRLNKFADITIWNFNRFESQTDKIECI